MMPPTTDKQVQAHQGAHFVPDPADPYTPLDAHVGTVRALYCEDGCGLIETSGMSIDDRDAAKDLAERGWAVRPHSMGGLTALCARCVEDFDREYAEDNRPTGGA